MTVHDADTEQKIAELVKTARITPEEGRRLRAALPGARARLPAWRLGIDPWSRLSPATALQIGLVLAAVSLPLSVFGRLRFDGAFDLHLAARPVGWSTAIIDQLLAWPATAVVFFAVARLLRARVRDALVVVGASRAPLAICALLLALLPVPALDPANPVITPGLLAVIVVVLPLVVWQFVVSFFAWRHLTGLVAPRVGLGFALAVVVAEVATKFLLSGLSWGQG